MAKGFYGKFNKGLARVFGEKTARKVLKARKVAAGYVLGEQVAAYVPTEHSDEVWHKLNDEELGALFRSFTSHLATDRELLAESRNVPIDMMIMQHSVVAWATRMIKQNADTLTVSIHNKAITEPKLNGNFEVTVRRLPKDHEFGEPGVNVIEEEDGKIKEFTISWKREGEAV